MSWLPVDYAARIILELCDVAEPSAQTSQPANPRTNLVYHVLNPTRFHWTRDMLPALSAAGLSFQTLPTALWMEKLRASDRDPTLNPPIKLLGWFESKYGHGAAANGGGTLVYQTEETGKKSGTVGRVPDVTDLGFVKLMVERLRREWGV
jgi:hypothetical protein